MWGLNARQLSATICLLMMPMLASAQSIADTLPPIGLPEALARTLADNLELVAQIGRAHV